MQVMLRLVVVFVLCAALDARGSRGWFELDAVDSFPI